MRRICLTILLVVWAGATARFASAQASFAIESAVAPRAEIPSEMLNALEPSGTRLLRVVNGVRIPVCELFWRKTVAAHRKRLKLGVTYAQLSPGILLGVLYLPGVERDFNGNQLEPGLYTMRYAQPFRPEREINDKDEMENRPRPNAYHDLVLLSRLESDKQTRQPLTATQLLKLSKQASSGEDPAMLRLVPVNPAYKGFPSIVSDDQGNCTVQFKLQAQAEGHSLEELDLAILLVTPPNFSADD